MGFLQGSVQLVNLIKLLMLNIGHFVLTSSDDDQQPINVSILTHLVPKMSHKWILIENNMSYQNFWMIELINKWRKMSVFCIRKIY